MRLPLATELKTRPGDNTKDARLKNSYAEVRGEQTVVRKRSGSTDQGLTSGAGMAQILTCWEGLLGVVGDALYLFFDNLEYIMDWSSATEWDSGTVYTSGSWVWYNGQLWRWVSGTTGVAPSLGDWSYSLKLTYDEDETYGIGDQVRVGGIYYYCYVSGTIGIPVTNVDYWGTTPPGTERYYASGAGYDATTKTSPVCASKYTALTIWQSMLDCVSCATSRVGVWSWILPTYGVVGSPGVGGTVSVEFHYGFIPGYAPKDCSIVVADAGLIAATTLYRTA